MNYLQPSLQLSPANQVKIWNRQMVQNSSSREHKLRSGHGLWEEGMVAHHWHISSCYHFACKRAYVNRKRKKIMKLTLPIQHFRIVQGQLSGLGSRYLPHMCKILLLICGSLVGAANPFVDPPVSSLPISLHDSTTPMSSSACSLKTFPPNLQHTTSYNQNCKYDVGKYCHKVSILGGNQVCYQTGPTPHNNQRFQSSPPAF